MNKIIRGTECWLQWYGLKRPCRVTRDFGDSVYVFWIDERWDLPFDLPLVPKSALEVMEKPYNSKDNPKHFGGIRRSSPYEVSPKSQWFSNGKI